MISREQALRFEIVATFVGANRVVVHYRGPRGLGAEAFWFDAAGKIFRAAPHYDPAAAVQTGQAPGSAAKTDHGDRRS